MAQTRRQSLTEVVAGVVIGYVVALAANAVIFPRYGFQPSLASNLEITALYTVISMARGYSVRRFFNWLFG